MSSFLSGRRLRLSLIPDLSALGYTRESPPTPHVFQTRQRLNNLESKVAVLEESGDSELESRVTLLEANLTALDAKVNTLAAGGGTSENNGGGGSGVSQADFLLLLQTVNSQTLLIDQLIARLNYADNYLKMIDEAIAVEGFPGWSPPNFE
jgi:hypothetical protein